MNLALSIVWTLVQQQLPNFNEGMFTHVCRGHQVKCPKSEERQVQGW